jgi:hypothetical protein
MCTKYSDACTDDTVDSSDGVNFLPFLPRFSSQFGMWYFAFLGPRNVYKDMLNNMVSPIDHVVMSHQNHTRTIGI